MSPRKKIEGPVGAPATPAGSVLPELPFRTSARVMRTSVDDAAKAAAAKALESNSDEFRTVVGDSSRWTPGGVSVLNPLFDGGASRSWDAAEGYDGGAVGVMDDSAANAMAIGGMIDSLGLGWHHIPYFACAGLARMAEGLDLFTSLLVLKQIRCAYDADLYAEAFLVCASFFGSFLGTYIFGVLSDKRGRWIAGWVFPLLMGGGLVAASCAPVEPVELGYTYTFVCRVVSGLGLGASPVFGSLLMEVVPTAWRGWAHIGASLHWVSIRLAVAALGASYIEKNDSEGPWPGGWRFFLLLNAAPCVLVGVAARWSDESPRFLVTADRANEAHELISKWAIARNKELPCARIRRDGQLQPLEQRGSVRRLFMQRRNTLLTLNMWILTFVTWFTFIGITQLTTIFLSVEAERDGWGGVSIVSNRTDHLELGGSDSTDTGTLEDVLNDPGMFPAAEEEVEEGENSAVRSLNAAHIFDAHQDCEYDGNIDGREGWSDTASSSDAPSFATSGIGRGVLVWKTRGLLSHHSCKWIDPEKSFGTLMFHAVSEMPGVLLPALFIDRVGRTKVMAASSAVAALVCMLVLTGPSRVTAAALLFAGRFLCTSTIIVSRLFTYEAFPTSLRATASCSCFLFGQVATLLTPVLLIRAFESDPLLPMALIATTSTLAFVSSLLLPLEPAGVALEECAPERTFLHKPDVGRLVYSGSGSSGESVGITATGEYREVESTAGSDDESEVGVGAISHRHRDSFELL